MNTYTSFISPFIGSSLSENHKPFLYEVGQKVRISKKIVVDSNRFEEWAGSSAQIISRMLTSQHHTYKVKMLHGDSVAEFFEEDLDRRYIRKNLDKRI